MRRNVQILTVLAAVTAVTAGCYQETSRGGDTWGLQEEPEATATQPEATVPPEDASPTEPEATQPAETGQVQTSSADVGRKIRAIIETNLGHMEAELWPDVAPKTVENFIRLAKSGFYENLPCHRMLPGFVVQFGKPVDEEKARQLKPIPGEFSDQLKHEGGTLSMARRPSDPDSATSQFFICFPPDNEVERNALASLDGKYAIFGKVVRGLAVLEQIEAVPTTMQSRGPGVDEPSKPTKTILLRTVRIEE